MLDQTPVPPAEPAPALPPKPVNEDELSLCEGDIVNIVSKEAPDRGWWRGELNGKVGLFPDNFVQILPPDPSLENRVRQGTDHDKT
ncbi:unnamed protein product [Leptidea sinapis]|uniref:SH3 domain-containing protein n=1 Tax=Leptidea sinapis TaxID=189913 RepID=A0A5E4QDA0_9NEOP|nr:unnamed protein product [Leptidea sinapis]